MTDALTDLVLLIFRTNGALLRMGDSLVAPEGLTSARWQVLGAIHLAGAPTHAPDIARTMGLTRQAVQKLVRALVEDGLVAARADPQDARSQLLSLTARGRRAYAQATKRWEQRAAELGKQLSAEKVLSAQQVLTELGARLTAQEEA